MQGVMEQIITKEAGKWKSLMLTLGGDYRHALVPGNG